MAGHRHPAEGQPGGPPRLLVSFTADGVALRTAPLRQMAPPALGAPKMVISTTHGTLGRTDDGRLGLTFVGFAFDDTGALLATQRIRVAVEVDDPAESFSGPYRTDFVADDGSVVASSSGAVQGQGSTWRCQRENVASASHADATATRPMAWLQHRRVDAWSLMEALTTLARTLVAAGRWLVPWACALMVSSALALVVDRGLAGVLAAAPPTTPLVAAPAPRDAVLISRPDMPSALGAATRSVLIVAVDPVTGDRTDVECDAPIGTFATDVMVVEASDFAAVTRACKWADTR